jgi:cytochrome P450
VTLMDADTGGMPERGPVVDFDYQRGTSQAESDGQWREMRDKCPVGWSELYGGHWVISRYAEVSAAYRDWELFSSERRGDLELTSIVIAPTKVPPYNPEELDPPEWNRYRKVLAPILSPPSAERMRPRLATWVTHFLDRVIETGRADFVYDLASPVPGAVTLEWLGFPEQDWERISHAFHDFAGFPPGSPEHEHALEELVWVNERIVEEVADHVAHPREDAISVIVTTDVGNGPMSSEYAEAMVRLAIGGGVDTTTSLVASALVHLHFHPQDRRALLDDPRLLDRATEEFLRMYPPSRNHARTVTRDAEFGGCLMRKGDRVLLSEASACHDERAFPDADRFVIDRFPNRHLAFGVGVHRCPGSHLARAEIKEMLTQVLERMPDYRVIEEDLVSYPSWGAIGGWARVPAVFTPGSRRG